LNISYYRHAEGLGIFLLILPIALLPRIALARYSTASKAHEIKRRRQQRERGDALRRRGGMRVRCAWRELPT